MESFLWSYNLSYHGRSQDTCRAAAPLPGGLRDRLVIYTEVPRKHPQHIALPRGCRHELESVLRDHQVKLRVEDQRTHGAGLAMRFMGELTPIQAHAARALLEHDTGVFVAPPGVGKTVLGT